MDADLLAAVAAVLLSLGFSYLPGLNVKFAGLSEQAKQLVMLLLLVGVALGSWGLACAGLLVDLFGVGVVCNREGAVGLARALLVAIVTNQGVFKISPKAPAVQELKARQAGLAGSLVGRG